MIVGNAGLIPRRPCRPKHGRPGWQGSARQLNLKRCRLRAIFWEHCSEVASRDCAFVEIVYLLFSSIGTGWFCPDALFFVCVWIDVYLGTLRRGYILRVFHTLETEAEG